eukprot:TRINITY_DN13207_c0_g1_i3.p1 TRINITY_DN13207_c0_g1~~TRINITY_DN13207_c0_g1_i3.p1  ORF type:complete len:102 (+),score=4.22 TRINITY_DN13207_c0_g1_i3:62-367(+)
MCIRDRSTWEGKLRNIRRSITKENEVKKKNHKSGKSTGKQMYYYDISCVFRYMCVNNKAVIKMYESQTLVLFFLLLARQLSLATMEMVPVCLLQGERVLCS